MKRWLGHRPVLVLGIIVLFGLAFICRSSPSFQSCFHKYKHDTEYQDFQKGTDHLSGWTLLRLNQACAGEFIDKNDKAINAAIAFFTLLLWWSTHRLWATTERLADAANAQGADMKRSIKAAEDAAKATQDSVEISRLSARLQLRAYMHLSAVEGKWRNGLFVVNAVFKNYGNTPCREVRIQSSVYVELAVDDSIDLPAPPLDLPTTAAIVPPNDITKISVTSKASKDFVDLFKTGTFGIFFYGTINYKDIFGEDQNTTFRLLCAGPTIFTEGQFNLCSVGNAST